MGEKNPKRGKPNSQEEYSLQDNFLKGEENAEMVGEVYQDKEGSLEVKIIFEDMDSILRGSMDTKDILGRKVKKKDIGRQCDSKQSTK